ncbi:MAG: hypothetical protein JWP43_3361 [Ramlibacter sp.]|nr:hypothetical protein [Ramlibacter sp.]
MNHRLVVLVAAGLMLTSAAQADWAFTQWGMTAGQVVAASGGKVKLLTGADRATLAPNVRREAAGSYTDDGIALTVRFVFDPTKGDGLTCVYYGVDNEKQGNALKDLMLKRYGKPRQESKHGAMGVDVTWDKPDDINLNISNTDPAFVTHCKKKSS